MPVGRHEDEVVGGPCSDRGGHLRPTARAELVGVDARFQAGALSRDQNPLRLVGGEDAGLAEDVAPFGQPRGGHRGDHLVDDEIDVACAAGSVFDGYLVRAHEGRGDVDGMRLVESSNDAQHFQLSLDVQPVTALDFARRRAAGEHAIEPGTCLRGQLVFGCGPRRGHGRDDAAAALGDAGVTLPGKPAAELRPPVAGEDGVRVGVDEAGEDGPLTGVDDARVAGNRDGAFEIGCGSGKDDALARRREGAVGDDLEPTLVGSAPRRGSGTGDELTAMAENQHGAGRLAPFVSRPRRFAGPLRRCGRRRAVCLPRTVEQDLVVGAVLLADELERAVERLNRTLERSLDVASAQAQLVDVAFDLLEPTLRLLQQEIRTSLRLADDELRFGLGRFLDLVRQALSGQQRVAEVGLALAMLAEQRLLAHQILPQAVDLAERVLVIVGGLGEERHDFGAVEAAQLGAEPLLFKVERRDPHHALGRR